MSTSYKVIIAAAAILILASSGLFIFTQNQVVDKLNVTTKSSNTVRAFSSVSNVKSIVVSPSSQFASQAAEVSKISNSLNANLQSLTQCNLPESENLVKTEDGCFEFTIGGKVISQNQISPSEIERLDNQYKEISKLYYSSINKKFISQYHKIRAEGTNKLNENHFEISLGMIDDVYIKNTFGDYGTDNVEINWQTYSIIKNDQNQWIYSLKKAI